MQDKWDKLKNWIINYEKMNQHYAKEDEEKIGDGYDYDRYCVAISCYDLISKMEEIEDEKK